MVELKFELGQKVWFFMHNHQGKMTSGKVVFMFEMYGATQYVIEIMTEIDPILEVRDSLTLSDKKNKPIGMWRNLKDSLRLPKKGQ